MFGGVSLTAIHTIPNPPLFPNTDHFVLFADQSLSLEENVTISSGDIGTNKTLDIRKDTIVNGNLFADTITIDKNTTINGNATFNKLSNSGEILGTKITPISLPIANLSAIQPSTTGTEDPTFQGAVNTLPAGNYRNITVQKDSTLTLLGGTYNLNAMELQEQSTLVFNAPIVLNIQSKLKGKDNISIFNGTGAKFNDLRINYLGAKGNAEDGDVSFGKNSFLNFALLAPNASVTIGKDSILRGRVLVRKIKVGKGFIGSREAIFNKSSDPTKLITDTDNTKYFTNEILVTLSDQATFSDTQAIANLVGGRIIGFMESANTYQIEVSASTAQELTAKIQTIRNSGNPFIERVFRDYALEVI